MQKTHSTVLNTLVRVQRFLDANSAELGTVNRTGYRRVLDASALALSGYAAAQTTAKHSGMSETAKERALRNALKLNHMRPIASVAAAQLDQAPEFVSLKMPPSHTTSRRLIAWAGSMRIAAAEHAAVFVDGGLPDDFLQQLDAAADALADTIGDRNLTRTELASATAGLDAEAKRGRKAVKVLNSLVEPRLANNLSLLAGWSTAKRYKGRSASTPATTIDASAIGASVVAVPANPSPEPAPVPVAPIPYAAHVMPPASAPAPAMLGTSDATGSSSSEPVEDSAANDQVRKTEEQDETTNDPAALRAATIANADDPTTSRALARPIEVQTMNPTIRPTVPDDVSLLRVPDLRAVTSSLQPGSAG